MSGTCFKLWRITHGKILSWCIRDGPFPRLYVIPCYLTYSNLHNLTLYQSGFYLIGMWYKRSEAQRRYSFFFSSTTLAGAFGGLLAAAIGKMDGIRGYKGWRWVFILEGLL